MGRKRSTLVAGMLMALAMVFWSASAHAWWESKWQYRKKIAFDLSEKGANIKENLTDVPVLVRLHAGNFTFANAKKDGSDLRFVSADDKVPLKFHIEKFDPKQAIALVWVRVPQLSGGGAQDSIWLYYGNEGAPAGQDAGGTYDTTQVLVYHLNDDHGALNDATAYANHASGSNAVNFVPCIIGNGYSFKGVGEKVAIPRSPSLNFAKGFTFSSWVRIDAPQKDSRLFSWDDGSQSIVVGIDQDKPYLRIASGAAQAATDRSASLSPKSWHHLAATAEPGKRLSLYLDGKEVSTVALAGQLPSPASDIVLGASTNGQNSFAGDVDEVELSNVARPAAWVAAAFAGQGPEGKLTTLQQEESGKGGGDNLTIHLMRVIARSISLDGWLIIGLCSFMLMLAAGVFITKFMALQKIIKGNQAFLETFRELKDPVDVEGDQDEFRHSTLYRIHQAGYEEIQRWISRAVKGQDEVCLTPTAVNIMRAGMDRASVMETQKINAWMIVLTLGISGGPFWGLLGTVWGVMNTFASLAEAGEANLTAIAPGVASALACTLFGLLVAIPALFAYSYLAVQIKNVNTDNRLFIDEYVVRVEEAHGEPL